MTHSAPIKPAEPATIPYARQDISEDDIRAVTDILRSDYLTTGPAVPEFESRVCAWSGAAHGVAANSATSALHIAYMALDLGPGDLVWTVPNTFVATANAALYCGADVDFVDTDPATYNMSVAALEAKLAEAAAKGRLPKIIAPVHFAGQSCQMAEIGALARAHGIRVVEDASHAIGGLYQGRPVGNCAHSDICVFSFHPVKIITTAEGGMAMTQDAGLADRMRLGRSHGVTREPHLMENPSAGGWYYEQVSLGYNYRMTDMQGALGSSQMDRLAGFIAARHRLAARYDRLLAGLDVVTPYQHPDAHSALHLYPVQVQDRDRVFAALRAEGILVNVHYIPVHTQPYYRRLGFDWGMFPNAEAYYRAAISLPMWATMTDAQQDRVVDALARAL